jgi:hypothetical protein
MRKNTSITSIVFILAASFIFYSCQKSIQEPTGSNEIAAKANALNLGKPEIVPYQFERINKQNFSSQGWREQQVNNVSGVQIFLDESDFMEIVCGPENHSDPRLIKGCFSMNLPTSQNPALRRVRLWKGGYSGTRLADLTEFKYSTYVVNNAPAIPILQIDVTNDGRLDFSMWFDPRGEYQEDPVFPPVVLNNWQQWNLLDGTWHTELATINGVPVQFSIAELAALFPDARIIDLPAIGGIGEGIRFNLDRNFYANSAGYLDGLIIGSKNKPVSTVFDFTCDSSN